LASCCSGFAWSLLGAGRFTVVALPFVVTAIAIGLLTVGLLGRYLGLSRQLSGLIAVGTGICGCTAIVATAPLLKANEAEVSYSIACITVFGLAAMFFYPYVAHYLFADQPAFAGLFLGTSIHETAQVAGAGLMYESQFNAPGGTGYCNGYQARKKSLHDRGHTAGRGVVWCARQRRRRSKSRLAVNGALVHRRLCIHVRLANRWRHG
jgi:hypothetical protein